MNKTKTATKQTSYTLIFKPEPEGGYTVIVPSLPGCVTYGTNIDKAKRMAEDAIKGYIASLKKHGEEIPSDNSLFFSTINIKEKSQISYA